MSCNLETKCERSTNKAQPSHSCPYLEELYNEPDELCNCCEECVDRCCDDI